MKTKGFYVCDLSGGYSQVFTWSEAEEIAIEESTNGDIRFIQDQETSEYVALFYNGKRWIPADGQACEQCGKTLDANMAHYSYDLTSRFFCSAECGVKLGVLNESKQRTDDK